MFELKKLNVHRIVETEQEKAKLLKEGFAEVAAKVVYVAKIAEYYKKGKA
jgi:hypothetical protein